jgi:ABC-type multidrug transport system fused ATPase/permease subunit
MRIQILDSMYRSTIYRSVLLLTKKDRKKLVLILFLQLSAAMMDLVGVALVGALGALAVAGFGAGVTGDRVNRVLEVLHLSDFSFQAQAAFLAILVAFVLTLRTISTVFISRRTLFFLSRKSASVSSDLVSRLLSQSLIKIKENTSQATHFSVTYGVSTVILGIVGTAITAMADVFVLAILIFGIFILDPIMAFATVFLFAIVALILYRLTSTKAKDLGMRNTDLLIKSDEKIAEVLGSYRELVVRNRREYYVREIAAIRLDLAETAAEMQFMPHVSKYVFETALVIGALLIGALQFALLDASRAVATLGVFLLAGTRIAPAVMRIQQGAISIKANLGVANPTLALIESLKKVQPSKNVKDILDLNHEGFVPKVEIKELSFSYTGSSEKTLSDLKAEIPAGTRIAIVGASGAGKTTLVDILLGILTPTSGTTTISGLPPLAAIEKWPGAIGYVPQDVILSHGSIRENISLGYPIELISDDEIWLALEKAQIADFVKRLPLGIDSQVGERGSRISGGQRQRLGIARALVTNPLLLILDEATSALDGATEADLTESFLNLDKRMTTIVVAHRLSTIKESDQILFLQNGQIVAAGTFNEVRAAVPDFDKQANLMGL